MDTRKLGAILTTVVVIGLIFFLRFRQRSEDSNEAREQAMVIVSSLDEYESNKTLLDSMAKLAHSVAFDAAYTMGGRRTRATFDADAYLDAFLRSMIDQAAQMGRADLKKPLLALHQEFKKVQRGEDEEPGESSELTPAQVAQADAADTDEPADGDAQDAAEDATAEADESPQALNATALAAVKDEELMDRLVADIRMELGDRSGADGVKAIRALTPCRRAIFMVQWVDNVAREDSLNELFGDEFGPLAVEAVKSFDAVGAKKRAVIMRRAVAAFVRENPDQKLVKKSKSVKKYMDAYGDASIADVDAAYDKSKENLNKLCIKYIRANAADCVVGSATGEAGSEEPSSGE
ncbi:hypothetical protein RAS2_36190 [Phycisphaerae bacterium RAS2]|nr:hypothetical protein RAS2_36190 [Phycisphaerae bacterium RAS2]